MVKIFRTPIAPPSLAKESEKKNGRYDSEDVIEQLEKDFGNKCYICELKPLQDPVVEHLLPHKGNKYISRKFDWNNLFISCGHCNGIKSQQKYDVGIIDCCIEDPEEKIFFRIDEKDVDVCAKDESDSKAVLTSELVYEVFNKKNSGMRTIKSAMRLDLLKKEINLLLDCLEELQVSETNTIVLRKLKALLDRKTAFAAFKRCYVRDRLKDYPELADFVLD